MVLEKSGPDRYDIKEGDMIIAYIEKNRMGTHGHWRGYTHYMYHEGRFLWAGADIVIGGKMRPWTDAPWVFRNIREVKDYYGI